MKEPNDCLNMEEIRAAIDDIDYQILKLFAKRMEYVKAIVKFKSDPDGIVARERQLEVFRKRREWASAFDLDPDLYEQIYQTLINWNVKKEMEIFRNGLKNQK